MPKGTSFATLSDLGGASAVFRVPVLSGEFPNYEVALRPETFSRLDEDGNPVGKEWEPIGLNSQYLKHCGDIAKVLDAGLPKEERSKNGMVVRGLQFRRRCERASGV